MKIALLNNGKCNTKIHKHTKNPAISAKTLSPPRKPPQNPPFPGRDMHRGREGGMWLGVSTRPAPSSKIRFAALLNVTGEERKGDAEGRGFVVADYLSTPVDLPDYLETLRRNGPHNAFNMVSAELG